MLQLPFKRKSLGWLPLLPILLGFSLSGFADEARLCSADYAKISAGPRAELQLRKLEGQTTWGPNVRLQAEAQTRDINSIEELKFLQYNVENLQDHKGKYVRDLSGKFVYDPGRGDYLKEVPAIVKPVEKLQGVADTILKADPDFAVLEEVEDLKALEFLNQKYLGKKYRTVLIPGNDERGINIGFLVKADLPMDIEVQSYKNVAGPKLVSALYSRDSPVVLLREKGSDPESKPLMAIIGTHLKSQRTTESDPLGIESKQRRADQILGVTELIRYYLARFGDDFPILMMGDFNSDIRKGSEFLPLWQKAGFKDVFDLAPAGKTVAVADRTTESFHPHKGDPVYSQLDSISGSKVIQDQKLIKEASIEPYLDADGKPRPLPKTFQERDKNPSDHNAVRAVLAFRKLLELFRGSSR